MTGHGAPVGRHVDVAVVGGGQSALATGYYLRRAGLTPGEDFYRPEEVRDWVNQNALAS